MNSRRPAVLVLCALVLAAAPAPADIRFHGGNIVNQQSVPLQTDFNNDGVNDLALSPNLCLGLLTLAPLANLHVAGNVLVEDCLLLSPIAAEPAAVAGNAWLYMSGGNLSYRDSSGLSVLASGGTGTWSSSAGNLYVDTGRVGIGTSSPSANLQVLGNVYLDRLWLADGTPGWPSLAFASAGSTGLYRGANGGNVTCAVNGAPQWSIYSGNLCLLSGSLMSWNNKGQNFSLGLGAMRNITTATYATIVGWQAGSNLATGSRFTAIGAQAGVGISGGQDITYAGYQAGYANNGTGCSAAGAQAMRNAGTSTNVYADALGVASLRSNTTQNQYNVALGYRSMMNATSRLNATAGADSLFSCTSGANNCALGWRALFALTTGTQDVAFGSQALASCTTGWNNAALGYQSGNCLTTGGNNTLAGSQSGNGLTTGGNNLLVGHLAGSSLVSGGNCVVIGHGLDLPSATASDQGNLGGLLFLRGGCVGIGTATPSANLHVNGNVFCGNILPLATGYSLGSQDLAWRDMYTVHLELMSDRRLKTDVRPLGYGLAELRRLQPVRFAWRDDGEAGIGFIAQDVAGVVPEAVAAGDDPDRPMSLRAGGLLPVVVAAQAELDRDLRSAIAGLDREIAALEDLNRELESEIARLTRRARR